MDTVRNTLSRVSIIAAFAALAACATSGSPVRVDQAESGPPTCNSFQWWSQSQDAASFTEQRVRDATLAELKEKGYSVVPEGADCRISYLFSASERPKNKPSVGVGAGGGSGGVGGGIGVTLPIGKRGGYSGTFTLDVIDAAKNAQVWSGSLDASFKAADLTPEEAKDAVETVLAKFPDASAN